MSLRSFLDRYLDHHAPKAGAFIVTLYGDVVVPRGGTLWIGNVIETCAEVGINESLVRTAVSRLVAAGRLAGERVGRKSFYRLTEAAATEFAAAGEILFAGPQRVPPDAWQFLVPGDATPPDAAERLARAGWGALGRVAVAPAHLAPPPGLAALRFTARPEPPADLRAFAAAGWQLDPIAAGYARFLRNFRPLAPLADDPDPALGLAARLVMLDAFRKVALADPRLPDEALPPDWPGHAAWRLFAELYRGLSAPGDAHVNRSFVDPAGPLRVEDDAIALRLAALAHYVTEIRNSPLAM
jgi:phenylacetic acid degradation operon negative regulatory protein